MSAPAMDTRTRNAIVAELRAAEREGRDRSDRAEVKFAESREREVVARVAHEAAVAAMHEAGALAVSENIQAGQAIGRLRAQLILGAPEALEALSRDVGAVVDAARLREETRFGSGFEGADGTRPEIGVSNADSVVAVIELGRQLQDAIEAEQLVADADVEHLGPFTEFTLDSGPNQGRRVRVPVALAEAFHGIGSPRLPSKQFTPGELRQIQWNNEERQARRWDAR